MKKISIADPVVATFCSWLFLFVMGNIQISEYSRELELGTNYLLLSILMVTLLLIGRRKVPRIENKIKVKNAVIIIYALIFLMWFFVNVLYSGYVPLLNLIGTGDSGYLDFGLKSISGFLNAAGCGVLAAVCFAYNINKKNKILYFVIAFLIVGVFVLTYTRQNVLTSLIQISSMLYMMGKIKFKKIIVGGLVFLMIFSIAGSFRSGDIKDIAKIKKEYMWVPEPVIWLYSYSYFNVLNLENVTNSSGVPKLDGSSVATLIPSVFRAEKEDLDLLAVSNFNVKSAASDIYYDLGYLGVIGIFFIINYVVSLIYNRKKHTPYSLYCISVLWFCGAFSFFVNFWFYLPVISQLLICYPLFRLSFKSFEK